MIFTSKLLNEGRSRNGKWSRAQTTALGLCWLPPQKWTERILGIDIPDERVIEFINLKNKHIFGQPEPWDPYKKRDIILLGIGFSDYKEYLRSELWYNIRQSVLKKQNYACYRCNKPATQVHHKFYTLNNLSGISTKYMLAVCARCHYQAEFKRRCKTTLSEANKRLAPIFEKPIVFSWDEINT